MVRAKLPDGLRFAALAVVAVALNLAPAPRPASMQPSSRLSSASLTEYFAARAQQRVCISGNCPCFDEPYRSQCFAEEEARKPPARGQIEGVCFASHGRRVDNAYQADKAIYARVRYNEVRKQGFGEVFEAWRAFVRETYEQEFPQTNGFTWGSQCVVPDKPNYPSEATAWTQAQEQRPYERVFMPVYGIADTPQERAFEAKAEAARKAADAERAREAERLRQIAEAKAVQAEAARRQRVSAIAQQIGPGKAAAAERLAKMNEEVAALRPKPRPAPSPSATKPSAPRQCTRRQGTMPASFTAGTREAAQAGVARARGIPGGSESIVASSVSGASCAQRNQLQLRPPPVGNCLACITEKQAVGLFGYVPGKGYPPPKVEWVCKATVTYTAERCGTGPSKVIAQ